MTVPMLADFAVRLGFGLIAALTITSWEAVPLRFFRIQSQIALGVLVLAALSQFTAFGASKGLWLLTAAAVASYMATVAWGLGLPKIATGLDLLILGSAGAWLVLASGDPDPATWILAAAGRGVSGVLLGSTLHSMLLGHYYLIAPAMTIAPLTRSLDLIVGALASRCVLAWIGIWWLRAGSRPGPGGDVAFLAMRWGMGLIGAGISVLLARRTAAIRSTQSATGILYITTIFVLFGELATMVMGR